MTKKLLALVLAVVMICSLGVVPVSAAGASSLQQIINEAATGSTVKLETDYNENITISTSITLDLNGHEISADTGVALVVNGVAVTIKDSTGDGAIISDNHAVQLENGASLALESGVIQGDYGVRVLDDASFTMNGGVIEAGSFGIYPRGEVSVTVNDGIIHSNSYAISGNGYYDGTDIEINGGEIIGTDLALYQPQDGKLTITGGYFEGKTAVYIKSGTVNITGGEFVGNGTNTPFGSVGNGANPTGDAIVLEQVGGNYDNIVSVSVSGGTFKSENAAAITSHNTDTATGAVAPSGFITGGTFLGEIDLAEDDLIAEGVHFTQGNGGITVNPKISTRCKVSFVADGRLVGIVLYRKSQTELTFLPKVPAKEGYVGAWAEYELNGENMIVRAVYTPIAE